MADRSDKKKEPEDSNKISQQEETFNQGPLAMLTKAVKSNS